MIVFLHTLLSSLIVFFKINTITHQSVKPHEKKYIKTNIYRFLVVLLLFQLYLELFVLILRLHSLLILYVVLLIIIFKYTFIIVFYLIITQSLLLPSL